MPNKNDKRKRAHNLERNARKQRRIENVKRRSQLIHQVEEEDLKSYRVGEASADHAGENAGDPQDPLYRLKKNLGIESSSETSEHSCDADEKDTRQHNHGSQSKRDDNELLRDSEPCTPVVALSSDEFNAYSQAMEAGNNVSLSMFNFLRDVNFEQDSILHPVVERVVRHLTIRKREILQEDLHQEHLTNSFGSGRKPQYEDDDTVLRDSGYIPCKVLVVLPMRNFAYRFLQNFIKCIEKQNGGGSVLVPKWDQFSDEYGVDEEVDQHRSFLKRPAEYRAVFAGNIDDRFCIGVSISRKWDRINLYTKYLNCDMLIASPLGLAHYTSVGECEERGGKSMCAGVLLSSIELFVMYPLDILLMQNWQRVLDVSRAINNPVVRNSTADLCDFRRLKQCFLDGTAKQMRQNVFLSAWQHAYFVSLFREVTCGSFIPTNHFHEHPEQVVGSINATPDHFAIRSSVKQIFIPVRESDLSAGPKQRLEYFTRDLYPSKIAPMIHSNVPVLLFVPNYFDFVDLRAYFEEYAPHSYHELCEYTNPRDQKIALYEFTSRTRTFIIMTERFYFYHRRFVRGAAVVLFYAPPLYSNFYFELVKHMNRRDPFARTIVLYSQFNSYELLRLVGSATGKHLLQTQVSRNRSYRL